MAAVLVHIDLDGELPHPASLVALAAGRHVASSWGATLYAAVIAREPDRRSSDPERSGAGLPRPAGSSAPAPSATEIPGIEAVETALARGGADKIVIALTAAPIAPLWAAVGTAWQVVLDHLRPRLVLFGADSPSAPELAARTGARSGARLLVRARAIGIDDVELRDRDGGYVRASDGGAAVALIGGTAAAQTCDEDVDLVVLAAPGGLDERVELVAAAAAEVSHTYGAVVALGDDVAEDARVVGDATRLAKLLGAQLVGGAVAARAGTIASGAVVERSTPLAPELCVTIGGAQLDLAGATSLIKIGALPGKTVDGALPGPVEAGLAELVERLEGA